MGTDCRIILPPAARLHDIADVTAFLLGCPPERRALDRDGSYSIHSAHVTMRPCDAPLLECCWIEIDAPDGPRRMLFHWELPASEWSGKGMCPRATPVNIALGRRLVRFFGGELIESDSEMTVNLRCPPHRLMTATNGQAWHDWQDAKAAVASLSVDEILDAAHVAAYPLTA